MATRLIYDKTYHLGVNVAVPVATVDILGADVGLPALKITGPASLTVPLVSIVQGATPGSVSYVLSLAGTGAHAGAVLYVQEGASGTGPMQVWATSAGVTRSYVDNAGLLFAWDTVTTAAGRRVMVDFETTPANVALTGAAGAVLGGVGTRAARVDHVHGFTPSALNLFDAFLLMGA
jgi:hypothetical protein